MKPVIRYPFAALQGQPLLRLALLLVAIEPKIGGLLVVGPRGSAKSTSARALADLLPAGRLVDLPLGASEEQLLGSLDLQAALRDGQVSFRPGLLAKADEGVLYVDEVNLLPDVLVDQLLDVCASGINRIERDGISHQHPARIALVGTMNPEEGELRPQLLDRFGLFVRLEDGIDRPTREAIVRSRLQFDRDPQAFLAQYAEAQAELVHRLAQARKRVSALSLSDANYATVSDLCHGAAVEGVRADLCMLHAAAAHAAWQGRDQVFDDDIAAVAELVLAHRRKAKPEQDPAGGSTDASGPSDATAGSDQWGAMPPSAAPIQPLQGRGPGAPPGRLTPGSGGSDLQNKGRQPAKKP